MVLFHVALGAALHCSAEQIARKAPPVLEELHEEFFDKYKHVDLMTKE
jgi:hypothetical protein